MKTVIVVLALLACGCASYDYYEQPPVGLAAYSEEVFNLSRQADSAYTQSRWLEAARHYQKLTQVVPNDAFSWFRLGNVYAHQGEFKQAIHAYEISIQRDANQTRVWNNLATTYLMNAQSALIQARQLLPDTDPLKAELDRRIQRLVEVSHEDARDTQPASYR